MVVVAAVETAQGRGAIVGDGDHDSVVALAEIVELLEQTADLHIGVIQESGEYLLEPRRDCLLLGAHVVPDLHAGIPGCQALIGAKQTGCLLPGEDPVPGCVPAVVEPPPVLVRERTGHVMRGMPGRERDVQEEGLVRGGRCQLAKPFAGLIDDTRREVVVLGGWLFDAFVAQDEFRIPLVGLA